MKNELVYDEIMMKKGKQEYKSKMVNWFCSEEMKELVGVFCGEFPNDISEKDILCWLVDFSDRWDYRKKQNSSLDSTTGERARWLILDGGLSKEQKECIDKVITKLGLLGIKKPSLEQYDYILALGGARMSCLYRTKYAWQMAEKYKDRLKALVLLGALRPVAETEREATDSYALGARTEFDLMEAALQHCGSDLEKISVWMGENEHNNLTWRMHYYRNKKNDFSIINMAAPSTDIARRANSADSYQFFWDKISEKRESSILLVTSQIYVPYQHIEAVRTLGLPYNMTIDTIGFPVEWNVNVAGGMMQYENYLQEIRSALQAMERLWKVIE